MINTEKIKEYHCPRWEELPDLELYMDQVITVLEKHLSVFMENEKTKLITSTMINNYVKQKLVRAPHNKKYDRGHIASFYIITLMKQIMPISMINTAILGVAGELGRKEAYELFCRVFENSLSLIFQGEPKHSFSEEEKDNSAYAIIRSLTLSYSNMLYAEHLLEQYISKEEKPKEKEKKEGKK